MWGNGYPFRDATLYCPVGKKVLGSGYKAGRVTRHLSDDTGSIAAVPDELSPVDGGNGWYFYFTGDFRGTPVVYTLYITCADAS